jgi:hypothetical protein
MYIRETLRILDELKLPKAEREAVDRGNLERIAGRKIG